ncbi:Protein F47E1.4 [Aphelenchoides avenae]|nr:Protein F47E1.4 [Aphelenchus avenae]
MGKAPFVLPSPKFKSPVTAVQNIERQFQIPSKISGFLVSAHDISYVPTVILISYFGSRGNRAKWIGAGAVTIGLAHIMTATPNFIFPTAKPQLNLTTIEDRLNVDDALLKPQASMAEMLSYPPLHDRIPALARDQLIAKVSGQLPKSVKEDLLFHAPEDTLNSSLYSVDEALVGKVLYHAEDYLHGRSDEKSLRESMRMFIKRRQHQPENDLKTLKRAAGAPFAFCHRMINDLRTVLKDIQCQRKTSNFGPLLIIFIALLALGVGRTMPWALGIPLIDDNVKSKSMPLYLATISFIRILGPICGFLIGSAVNKWYFTFPATAPQGLTPRDPTWIGAWWLGFLIVGIASLGPSIALYFFPQQSRAELNGKRVTRESKKLKLFDKHVKKDEGGGLRGFLDSYKDVLKSNVYRGAVIARVLDVLAFKGYMVFLPKYLENHYGVPGYKAHMYMAAFGVVGFASGTAAGGFLTRRLKLNGRVAALFVLVVSSINIGIYFSKSLMGCHSVVNSVGAAGLATNFNYTSSCNADCGCESAKLFPVCDADGQVFFSPCHAGCRRVNVIDINSYNLEFSECDCSPHGVLKRDLCRNECKGMLIVFCLSMVASAFVAGTGVVPGMLLLIRSVPPATRSLALGLQGFLVSGIGTLPSPILWGAVIDSACLIWDQTCSSRGSCSVYEPTTLRVRMHYMYCVIRGISLIADLFVFYYAKGLNLLDEEDPKAAESEAETAATRENVAMNVIPE